VLSILPSRIEWWQKDTQLDHRRGWVGSTYYTTGVLFDALKLASIYALCCKMVGPRTGALPHFLTRQGLRWLFVPVHLTDPANFALADEIFVKRRRRVCGLHSELDIHIFEEDGQQRNIYHDFNQDLDAGDDDSIAADDEHDYYFDDDTIRLVGMTKSQNEKKCRRVSWHRLLLLNCNSFHELGLASNTLRICR
jgi:hypothetical protein